MEKVKPIYIKSLLCSIIILLISVSSYGSHIVGMDLSYTWISGNTYQITAVVYGN